MPTKTVSTQQSKQVLDASHYLLVSNNPVVIFDIEGQCNSTTGAAYYIQLLGTATPISGTTIPLYSRECVAAAAGSGNNGFSFVYRPDGLSTATMLNPVGGTLATTGLNTLPVYVAISSTDNVYTAVAASTQITIDFEESTLGIENQVITGDLTTGVDSLTVFSDPNVAKRLTQFKAINNTGATAYIMLFAYATPANGSTPLEQWTLTNGQTLTQSFGRGYAPMQGGSTYVQHTGCYLYGSSTTQTLTATVAAGWNIQAFNI